MDPVVIVALITGISGLVIGVLSHIKHSSCFCCDLETRALKNTPPQTPANQVPKLPPPVNYQAGSL
jgi:hypothetical protein